MKFYTTRPVKIMKMSSANRAMQDNLEIQTKDKAPKTTHIKTQQKPQHSKKEFQNTKSYSQQHNKM